MKKLLLSAGLVLAMVPAAHAAQANASALVVATCGAQAFPLLQGGQPVYAPFTILQNGTLCTVAGSGGGGGGNSSGAVYGPDATGAAPTKPPLFIGGVDPNGNIIPFTFTAKGLQFFDQATELALGSINDPAATVTGGVVGSGSAIAQLRATVNQLAAVLAKLNTTLATNETQINGVAPAMGSGASNTGTQRVITSTDSTVGLSGTLPAFAATPTFNIGTGLPTSYPDATADAVLGTTTDPAYTSGTGAATVPSLLRGIANKIDAANQAPLVAGSALIGGTTAYVGSSPASSSNPVPVSVQSGGTATDGTANGSQTISTSATSNSTAIPLSSRSEVIEHITGLTATGASLSATLALADGTYSGPIAATPIGGGANVSVITTDGWYRFKVIGATNLQFTGTAGTTAGTVTFAGTASTNAGNVSSTVTNSAANPVNTSPLVQYSTTPPTLTNGQTAPAQADASGRAYADISPYLNANSPPGGAATTASSPVALPKDQGLLVGTGESTPSTLTANQLATLSFTLSHAVRVDGSGVTQPISAAALPLPSGAATSANQTTAAAQGSTTSGQTGPLSQATVVSTAPTYAAGTTNPLTQTTAGLLRTDANISPYLNTNNQKNMAGSSPAVLPSDQSFNGGGMPTAEFGSSLPAAGIAPSITQSGTSVVGKASQGNLYSSYAILTAAASAQTYLVTINAATAPASGASITPVDVAIFPSNAIGATASTNYAGGPPNAYSTGIVSLVTTSLTTYTPGAASFIQDRVR